jgi:UDP-3-O-[3-hydroxymyristoyl] N-acetylglucosamine deacetylase
MEPLVVQRPVRVQRGESWASLDPDPGCRVEVSIDFEDAPWVKGAAELSLTPGAFVEEVAWARTFVLLKQVRVLREMGRGRGATEENTVVVGAKGPLNPLRAPDEIVRHKLLDAVGDLSLLGAPLRGRMRVHRGSHALHLFLLREAAALHGWS